MLTRNKTTFLLILITGLFVFGTSSCNSKKKAAAAEAAALLAKQEAQAKEDLIALLSDDNTMSLEEKERKLQQIKDLGLENEEIQSLIRQVEAKLKREREAYEEAQRKAEAEAAARAAEEQKKVQLEARKRAIGIKMNNIANASTATEANAMIEELLGQFSGDDASVVIVISEVNGNKDYDRPTTIRRYLEYLKDTSNTPDLINGINFDSNGKIQGMELRKKS